MDEQLANHLFRHLGRHLVALCGVYVGLDASGRPTGPERGFSHSGFVITLDGKWYFVTAGHVLGESLGDHIAERRMQLRHCSLADYFGMNAQNQHPTVISYDDVPKFHVYDREQGLDIGVFQLRDLYVSGLQSNGVSALSEEDWATGETNSQHTFAILGFPEEEKEQADTVTGWIRSCLAGVTPCEPPEDAPATTHPMFVGRLNSDEPGSMKGFSGGPIFRFHPEGIGWRYELVGLQSLWRKAERITFGCTMPVVAQLIRQRF